MLLSQTGSAARTRIVCFLLFSMAFCSNARAAGYYDYYSRYYPRYYYSNYAYAPITLQVQTPAKGSFTNKPYTHVYGAINNRSAIVTVSGVRAMNWGARFAAYYVRLRPGPNTLQVRAYDPYTRQECVATTTVTLDTVPPVIRISNAGDGQWTNRISFVLRGNINEPGGVKLNGIPYSVWGSFQFSASVRLKEYRNDLVLEARDRAGNIASKNLTVYLDSRPPHLVITGPADGSVTNKAGGTLTGTLNEPGYVIFNGRYIVPRFGQPVSLPYTLKEGANTLAVSARDRGGNITQRIVRVTLDTQAPVLRVSGVANGGLIRQAAVTLTGSLNEAATLMLNGAAVPVSTDRTFRKPLVLREGANELTLAATDRAGNVAGQVLRITLDTQPPSLRLTDLPSGDAWIGQTSVPVAGDVSEAATVTLNGVHVSVGADRRFRAAPVLREGVNTLVFGATDSAGNAAQETVQVRVDSTPPSMPVVRDSGAFTENAAEITAVASDCRDDESGIAEYQFAIASAAAGQPAPSPSATPNVTGWTAAGLSTTWKKTGLSLAEDRTYYILARAKNRAGAYGAAGISDGIVYRMLRPPRIVGISVPARTRLTEGNHVDIHVQAVDPQAGAMSYRLLVNDAQEQGWQSGNTLRWSPRAAQFGVRRIKVEVKNASNLSASHEAEVFVLRRPKNP